MMKVSTDLPTKSSPARIADCPCLGSMIAGSGEAMMVPTKRSGT